MLSGWCLYCLSMLKSWCGLPIHKIFIASGILLQLLSTCLQYRVVLPMNFVTYLKLISSCLEFTTIPSVLWLSATFACVWDHCFVESVSIWPHLFWIWQVSQVVSLSPSAERQRGSLLWQQESELLKSLSSESLYQQLGLWCVAKTVLWPCWKHAIEQEFPCVNHCVVVLLSPPTCRHYWSDID